jgi:GT2 family glycosyltransferase
MRTAVVIPTLGARALIPCLEALAAGASTPERTVVVHSGKRDFPAVPDGVEVLRFSSRLGFAAAVNAGLAALNTSTEAVAIVNDDTVPSHDWLEILTTTLGADDRLAAAQGTVIDCETRLVDGRGIHLDRWGLPVQIDNGISPAPEPETERTVLAVSCTAAVFRSDALEAVKLTNGQFFDPSFGSYHEDLDLGLRLARTGWKAAWVPGALCAHHGSVSGRRLRWRHPWWILSNRWRVLAGNLAPGTFLKSLPRFVRGELRALNTLARHNKRAFGASCATIVALPWIVSRAWLRQSPGARLTRVPWGG